MNTDLTGKTEMKEMNLRALECISAVLMQNPRIIEAKDVQAVMDCGVSEEEAVMALLSASLGFDARRNAEHEILERKYFRPSIRRLDAQMLSRNSYYQMISFPEAKSGDWTMTHLSYAPYELFVRDDLLCLDDGREIPQLGYFGETFSYPAVLEGGREWMTITPNEIATMQPAIDAAKGHVVVMGLGLGYYAFMISRKEEVSRVTVIEKDRDAIALFKKHILDQFPHKEKIRIVCADAFEYVQTSLGSRNADYAFVDLWHDVSDGAPMYLRMKALERFAPETKFMYWIETSIRAFLRSL